MQKGSMPSFFLPSPRVVLWEVSVILFQEPIYFNKYLKHFECLKTRFIVDFMSSTPFTQNTTLYVLLNNESFIRIEEVFFCFTKLFPLFDFFPCSCSISSCFVVTQWKLEHLGSWDLVAFSEMGYSKCWITFVLLEMLIVWLFFLTCPQK